MDISDLRKELGLSQEAFGALIGLKSKGQVCTVEAKGLASVRVALEIERISEGRIDAADLNKGIATLRGFEARHAVAS